MGLPHRPYGRKNPEHKNSITEVWPGIFSGSALVHNPEGWKLANRVDHVWVMSRTAYQECGWSQIKGVSQLFLDDTPEGLLVGQGIRLARILSLYNRTDRVAFLCQAGLNRSSLMACLWRWWWTGDKVESIVKELIDARVEAGAPDVLCNDTFVADLKSIDAPLNRYGFRYKE